MTMEKNNKAATYIAQFIKEYGTVTKGGARSVDMGEIPYKKGIRSITIRKMHLYGDDIYLTYTNGTKGKPITERLTRFTDSNGVVSIAKMIRFCNKRE